MQEANVIRDRFVKEFAENYMEKLFYFCLKKTGSNVEAEDLTQDIALNIITALNKGTIPTNFAAWIWQIARNRFSVWAIEKHKRNEFVAGSDICDYELEDDSLNVLDEMIYSEQLSLLRRELAFIKSDYRYIVVAYYIDNKSIRDIALSLSLSISAVQQRLHRARKILKEGMYMAREFGKRSYNPEQVTFVMSGRCGQNGQPWSIVKHLLCKNIFLETYENPQSAEELSLELGIALPYMEDELEFLTREQLLRKNGNKYQTDFPIISKEEQRKEFETNKRIQEPLTEKICELIDLYIREDCSKVNYNYIGYEAAKWALIVRAFDWLKYSSIKRIDSYGEYEEYKNTYPSRPDDGAWILTGLETIDWENPMFVGLNGYLSYDMNEIKFDIDFGQFKFFYENINARTPDHLTYMEAYTLWLVCAGRVEECDKGYIEVLIGYGYLKREDTKILPNILIFNSKAEDPNNDVLKTKLTALRDEIYGLLSQAPGIGRGFVVEQALKNGWIKYDNDTVKTIGAYIYI